MATEKDRDLVQFLISSTVSSQIQWQAAANPDQFVAGLRGKYSIRIARLAGISYLEMKDQEDRELLSISSEDYYPVDNLFDLARRVALRVDEAIDEILRG